MLPVNGLADAQLALTVSDTGMGISEEVLPHVFELFAQGEKGGAYGGLGIGLALAKRLVELHGGTIEAYSPGAGHGSTFMIKLPLSRAAAVPTPARAEVQSIKCRAVIIDDNRDAAETISMVIEQLGGVARTADNAITGLDTITEFNPIRLPRPRHARHRRLPGVPADPQSAKQQEPRHRGIDRVGPGARQGKGAQGRLRRASDEASRSRGI
jgi:hypothetical protein